MNIRNTRRTLEESHNNFWNCSLISSFLDTLVVMTRAVRAMNSRHNDTCHPCGIPVKHFDPEDLTVLEFVLDVYNSGDPVVPDYGLGGLE
jgi:hypothetical protein